MNYIKSIELQNFQSHKKTEIKPAPPGQLTVIVGPSDSGKTALIRGLKWLAYNNPQGNDFIRVGTSGTLVSAFMADESKVSRYRTKGGVNRYLLEPQGKTEQVFEGFGSAVPLEIQQALEIAPIDVGDMEFMLNLSEQLDGPFLGNQVSASARAKVLGKLSGVEEVDYANKTLGTDLYRKRREVEGIRNQIDYLGKQIDEYSYLDELGPMVEIVEKNATAVKKKAEQQKLLKELKFRLEGTRGAIAQAEEKIASLSNIETFMQALSATEGSCHTLQKLTTASNERKNNQAQIDKANQIIEATKDVDNSYNSIITLSDKKNKLQALFRLQGNRNMTSLSLKSAEATLDTTKSIPEALELTNRVDKRNGTLGLLSSRIDALGKIALKYSICLEVIVSTEDLTKVGALLVSTLDKQTRVTTLISNKNTFARHHEEIKKVDSTISLSSRMVDQMTEDLKKAYEEAGTCPLCGSELEPEKLLKEVI